MPTPEERIAAGQELRKRGRLSQQQDAALQELERRYGMSAEPAPPRAGKRGGMVEEGTISREDYMRQRGPVNEAAPSAPDGSLVPMASRTGEGLLGMKPVASKGMIKDVGATQRALVEPQALNTEKMSRAQSFALGVNDLNPVRLATGDRGYDAAMTQSLKDNPFTTRGGQGASLTAGGGAQLFQKGVMLAPKLVAPAVAARLSGPGVGSQLARYSGRLAALMGLGAADYYAYNAIAEAPNQARETGAPSPTMGQRIDYANSQVLTPAGLVASAIPGAGSLVARPVRAALARGKNLVQTGLNKALPNAVPAPRPGVTLSTMLTPADVQKRVAGFAGSLTTMSRTDAEKAIDMLLKRDFDPDEAEKMVRFLDYAGKSEVPETLFQLMPNLRRVDQLTVALGTVGGDAKEALAKVLGAQAQESPAILRNALRKAMGASGEDFYAMQKGIQADQLSAPKEGYAAAYAKEVSDDTWETQILPQLRTKYGREAVADAADYAEGLAGTDPAKLGVARQLAELRDALSSQGATPGKVSTQSLDYIDRMLGDVAEGLKSGSGRREIAKGPKGVQQGIRGDANSGLDVETGLADPRRLSFELKSAEEALTFGRKAFKDGTDIETLLDEFAYEMSKAGKGGADSETVRGALLMGWLRGAEDEISKATNPQSVIRRLYGSERQREKLLAMMPELADDAGAGFKGSNTKDIRALIGGKRDDGREMAGMIDRLKRISGDYNRIIGNSQSAQRAAAVLEESGAGDRINRLFDAVLAPKRAAVDIAKAGINIATKPGIYQPGVNRELGRLLTARGKAQLLSVIDEIRQRAIATGKYKPPGGAPPPAPRTPPSGGAPGHIRAGGFAGIERPRVAQRPTRSETFFDERLTPQENKAVEMRRNGFTVQEIADELDTSEGVVKKAISVAKAKGADIGDLARDTQTADILALKAKQLSNSQIAQRTGISPDVIKVTLSKERRRLRDAGQNLPNWLAAKSAGISVPAGLRGDIAPGAAGGFIGFNQDGEPITADNIATKLRNAAIGVGLGVGANRIPVRSGQARNALADTATAGMGKPRTTKTTLPDHGYDEIQIGKASVEVTRVDDRMTINRLKVPENARGQGEASRALDAVLQQADEQGVTTYLKADPVGTGGMTQRQLEAFYKSRGFVSDGADGMVRKPDVAAKAARFETPGSPEWEAAKAKGLDMSQAATKARAKEQGFDTDEVLYHGTDRAGFDQFDVSAPARARSEGEQAVFLTNSPTKASVFAGTKNQSIMPLYVRGRIKTITPDDAAQLMIPGSRGQQMAYRSKDFARIIDQAKAEGFDGVRFKNVNEGVVGDQIAIFDPSNIRSVNAAFDPDKAASPILTAGLSNFDITIPGQQIAKGLRALDRRVRSPKDPRLTGPAIGPMPERMTSAPAIEQAVNPTQSRGALENAIISARFAEGQGGQSEAIARTIQGKASRYQNSVRQRMSERTTVSAEAKTARDNYNRAQSAYEKAWSRLLTLRSTNATAAEIKPVADQVARLDTLRKQMQAKIPKQSRLPDPSTASAVSNGRNIANRLRAKYSGRTRVSRRSLEHYDEVTDLLTNPARVRDAQRVSQARPLGTHEKTGQALFFTGAAGAGAYGYAETKKRQR